MEFWKLVAALQGKVLQTLYQRRLFNVLLVTASHAIVVPQKTEKNGLVPMKEIEGAYCKLKSTGKLTRVQIEYEFSPRNPAYVAAILANLPGVKFYNDPIITLEI